MAESQYRKSEGQNKKKSDRKTDPLCPSSKKSDIEASLCQYDDTAGCSNPDNSSSISDAGHETQKCSLDFQDAALLHSPSELTDVRWNSELSTEQIDESQPLNGAFYDAEMRPTTLPILVKNMPKERLKRYPSDPDLQCGLSSSLRAPRCMQYLATKSTFLLLFCLASVFQGMFYTYFVSVLTTIERLFQIKSKTTGLIMSATEIGQIGGGLFLSYYGGRGHRPKWISAGMFVFAVCTLLCALPHYLFGNDLLTDYLALTPSKENPLATANICVHTEIANHSNASQNHLQEAGSDSSWFKDQCQGSSFASTIVLGIFFVALLGVGLGQTAVYNLGIPYIDDNVGARESPAYFGITIGIRIFGPTLGFVLGALCTRLYIDPLDDPGFDPSDPRWIGAWWLGLIIISCCLIIVSLFMMIFPRKLPPNSTRRDPEVSERLYKISETSTASTVTVTSQQLSPQSRNLHSPSIENTTVESLDGLQKSLQTGAESPSKQKNGWDPHMIQDKKKSASTLKDKTARHSSFHSLSGKVLSCFSKRSFRNSNKGGYDGIPPKNESKEDCQTSQENNISDFHSSLCRLLKNKILLLRTASSVLHLLPISGLYTFLPKYLETQFRLTVHSAAMISGTGGILVMGLGIFVSGAVIRKLNPLPSTVALWIATTACLYSAGMCILMFLGCSHDDFQGMVQVNGSFSFEPLCENACSAYCDPTVFSPICSSQGNTYFSACHAGCSSVDFVNGTKELLFENCECLDEGVTASLRLCDAKCDNLAWYIAVFCLFVIIHSTSEVGGMLLTLRCVKPHDKAMALGLISVAVGLFGNVPCPIMYGAVVDYACIQWRETCNEQGACQLYDTDTFRYFFHGTTATVMFLAFLVDVCVWRYSNEISFDDENPDESQSPQDMPSNCNRMTSCPTQDTLQSPLKISPDEDIITRNVGEIVHQNTPLFSDFTKENKLNFDFLKSDKELRESFI